MLVTHSNDERDIFEFEKDGEYIIVLDGGIQLQGIVVECISNGIVLETGHRIPQSKILFFMPAGHSQIA